jgi:hypothetical protein
MALAHSPQTVTTGLVFYYDMGNPQKSWKGAPTTNLYADGDFAARALHPVRSGTWAFINDPRDPTKTVLRALPSGSNQYHGRDIPAVVSTVYSLQMEVYVSVDFNGTSVQMYPEQGGGGASVPYDLTKKGTWQTLKFNGKAATTTNIRMLAYVLSAFTVGYVLVSNVQVEQSAICAPFTAGTRSNTQAVLDLTGRRTITIAGTPTYGTDGTFNFNSSGSTTLNLGSGSNFLPMPSLTLEAWVKTPGLGAGMTINGIWGFTYGIRVDAYSNGSVAFVIGTDVTTFVNIGTTGVNINDNAWHHIVAVKSGDTYAAIYVDGVVRASAIPVAGWSGTNPWAAMEIQIGRDQNNLPYYFNGRIDSAKVYNTGLSATEVQQNFNALRGRYS